MSFPNPTDFAICQLMNDARTILQELHTSIGDALRRAEEHMSHVQRQLAGWGTVRPITNPTALESSISTDPTYQLDTPSSQATDVIDQELASVQASLSQLVQQGRQLKK